MVLPSDRTYPAVATPIHGNPLHDAVSRQMDLAMEARLARSADALAQLELLLGLPPALHVVLATRRHPQPGCIACVWLVSSRRSGPLTCGSRWRPATDGTITRTSRGQVTIHDPH
jgi:hypothetical protein